MWPSADIVKQGMFLAGVSLLALILLRRIYRRYGRRRIKGNTDYASYRPDAMTARSRSLSTAPSDVLRWHVELHDTARELKAELDSKMRALQLLIGQAREEADRLERILALREDGSPRDAEEPAAQPAHTHPALMDAAQRQAEIYHFADQGLPAAAIAEQVGRAVGDIELILSLRQHTRRDDDDDEA